MPALTTTQPAEPNAAGKARIAGAVDAARDEILDLSHRIHADPEPAFEEHQAAAWVAEILAPPRVRRRASSRKPRNRVRATLPGGGAGEGPRIGILAEYDALPGLGHGCGHNTMAASGVGAAIALAASPTTCPGEIVFLGTPAEERGSGKQIMIDDGLFEGIDAALLYHPCDRNHVETHPLASEDVDVVYTGLQSHASADPWRGKNALDALILLFTSVGLWRQQLHPERPRPRDHPRGWHGGEHHPGAHRGLVHDPERRSESEYEGMQRPVPAVVRGRCAGDRHDGRGDLLRQGPDDAQQHGPGRALPREHGCLRDRRIMGDDPNSGSTDMANVSWVCPAIHPDLAIADEGTPGHSILFRDAAASPQGDETTLLAATLIAQTAVRPVQRARPRGCGLGASSRRRTDAGPGAPGCYHRPRRVQLDDGFEPAAPPSETVPDARILMPRPSPEDTRG